MPSIDFTRYYRPHEVADALAAFAEEYPGLAAVRSIGASHEGRDLLLITLTSQASGADTAKPAYWVDANIHATEVTGCMAALHLIQRVLAGYGEEQAITDLLDQRALCVLPCMNPDGMEQALTSPVYVRSGTRRYPYDDDRDGMSIDDLWTYKEIGARGTAITSYRSVSVFHGFRYHPRQVMSGAFDDWAYDQLGIFAFTVELWDMIGEAGIKDHDFIEWFRDHPEDDDLKLLAWNDEQLGGAGFVGWRPFDAELHAVRPITVTLDLPPGAELITGELVQEIGQREGRANKRALWGASYPSDHLRKRERTVRAPAGGTLRITAAAQRAGSAAASLRLDV